MKNHNKLMLVFGKNSAWKINGSSSNETDSITSLNESVKGSSINSKSFSHQYLKQIDAQFNRFSEEYHLRQQQHKSKKIYNNINDTHHSTQQLKTQKTRTLQDSSVYSLTNKSVGSCSRISMTDSSRQRSKRVSQISNEQEQTSQCDGLNLKQFKLRKEKTTTEKNIGTKTSRSLLLKSKINQQQEKQQHEQQKQYQPAPQCSGDQTHTRVQSSMTQQTEISKGSVDTCSDQAGEGEELGQPLCGFSITQQFTNSLISRICQALLVRQIDQSQCASGNNNHKENQIKQQHAAMLDNILSMFGISIFALNKAESKREYLITKMNEKIDSLLAQSIRVSKERDNAIQQLRRKAKETNKNQDNEGEMEENELDWLDIPSAYPALQKKLKSIILQKINLYENQERILRQQEIQKAAGNSSNNNRKTNKQQHNDTSCSEYVGIKCLETSEVVRRANRVKQVEYLDAFGQMKNISALSNVSTIANIQKQQLQQQQRSTQADNQIESSTSPSSHPHPLSWSDSHEKILRHHQKRAIREYKQTTFESISTKSLALHPLLLQELHNLPSVSNRQRLLSTYANGETLSTAEYAFLANTSKLLNSCIDKKFIQQAANIMGETVIDKLERSIAEDILLHHELLSIELKKRRTEYFQKKNDIYRETLIAAEKAKEIEQQEQLQEKSQHRSTRLLRSRLRRIVDENPIRQASYKNFFIRLFVHKLKERMKEIKRMRFNGYALRFNLTIQECAEEDKVKQEEKQKQQQLQFISRISTVGSTSKAKQLKDRRHLAHPPSVLALLEGDEEMMITESTRVQCIQRKIDDFKLKLKDGFQYEEDQREMKQTKFQCYFSGGPQISQENTDIHSVGKPKIGQIHQPQQLQLQHGSIKQSDIPKIVRLQRFFRRVRLCLIVNKLKVVEFERKIILYQNKLNCLFAKRSPFRQAMIIQNTALKIAKQQRLRTSISPKKSQSKGKKHEQESAKKLQQKDGQEFSLGNKSQSRFSQLGQNNNNNESNNNKDNINLSLTYSSRCGTASNSPKSRFNSLSPQSQAASPSPIISSSPQYYQLNQQYHLEDTVKENQTFSSVSQKQLIQQELSQQQTSKPQQVSQQQQQQQQPFIFRQIPHSNLKQLKEQLHIKASKNNYTNKNNTISDTNTTAATLGLNSSRSSSPNGLFTSSKSSSSINSKSNAADRLQHFLMKQSKLLACAKNNFFQGIQNSGFLYTTSDTMKKDSAGNSPLYYAVLHSNQPFVVWLLAKGASPNQICSMGNTPVHIAFQQGDTQIIQRLLQNNGDINRVNVEGYTPLALCPQGVLSQLDLQKAVIFSGKTKHERNLQTFDNHQLLYRQETTFEQPHRLQVDNFYPLLNHPGSTTVALHLQTSE